MIEIFNVLHTFIYYFKINKIKPRSKQQLNKWAISYRRKVTQNYSNI